MTKRPTTSLIAGLGLAVVVALFWAARLVWGGAEMKLANADLYFYFYPLYEATYRRLAAGDFPLWNPYQLCGLPWIATLQGGFFYPGHALYLILPTYLALAVSAVLHLVFVALATTLFARRAGLGPAAAGFAALLFTLRGSIPSLTVSPNALEAAAWLPVGGVAVLGLARGKGRGAAALLAIATAASFLAGYPQTTVYVVYAWATLLLALLVGASTTPRRLVITVAAFGGALALGALAAGIQLVPAAELTRLGTRETRELALNLMFPMGTMANPLVPILRDTGITGSQFSFGVIGLSLLPAAILSRPHRRLALWALGLGLLSLAFALGPLTSVFRLYFWLPLMSWFRLPSRIFFLTDFCFAVLAGVALDVLVRSQPRGAILPVAASIACALALGALQAWHGRSLQALLAGGCVLALVAGRWWRAFLPGVLLLLATVELFAAPSPGLSWPYTASAVAPYAVHERVYQTLAVRAGHDRVWILPLAFYPPLASKLPTRYGLRSIGDYEPLNLRRQADYFLYLTDASSRVSRHFSGGVNWLTVPRGVPSLANRRRLLDLVAMRFFLTTEGMLARPEVRSFATEAGFVRNPSPAPGLALFENPRALPRAYTVYRTRAAPPPEALLRELSLPTFDPLVESFVEGDPGLYAGGAALPRGEPATFLRDEERVVEVEATLAAPGLLVLGDPVYPGWHATVDGVPAPIFPTNHLFRGVPVPAGRHRVRFEYRPWSVAAGAASTVAGTALIALLLLARRVTHSPETCPPTLQDADRHA